MSNNLKEYTNRLFFIYLLLGVSYLSFLVLLFIKVIPGAIMQLLFLIEAISKESYSVRTLISNGNFLESMLIGILLVLLLLVLIKGVIKSISQYLVSVKYLKSLKTSSKYKNYISIKSSSLLVFTAGFIHPKIYISESLIKELNEEQLKAVLFHELSHKNDLDPLRGFIVQFINNILPLFPYKTTLANLFKTSVELKSDQNSIKIIGNVKPIIESIYKILKKRSSILAEPYLTYFSNMPNRIPILVGISNFNTQTVMKFLYTFLFISVLLPVIAISANFYMCEHIEKCLIIFVKDLNKSTSSNLCNVHSMSESVDCPTI